MMDFAMVVELIVGVVVLVAAMLMVKAELKGRRLDHRREDDQEQARIDELLSKRFPDRFKE